MKKVLIALDYDPTAQKVAEVGYSMAKAMNAKVVLLHVVIDLVHYSSSYLNMGPLQLDSIEGLKDAAQHFLDKSKKHLGDENITTLIDEGDYAMAILNRAEDMNADVIVMGSQSRKWLENIVMGSVTEKVLRHTTIPLFIIPTKKRE